MTDNYRNNTLTYSIVQAVLPLPCLKHKLLTDLKHLYLHLHPEEIRRLQYVFLQITQRSKIKRLKSTFQCNAWAGVLITVTDRRLAALRRELICLDIKVL